MANFTSEVKRELFAAPPKDPCCKKAALFALLATGGSYQDGRIEFVSENERLSALFLALAESVYSVRFDIKEAAFDPKRERDRLTFSYAGGESARIAHEAGFSGGRGIAWAAKRECCALSCLKAAFLGGGSCTVPAAGTRTGYHLECVFFTQERAEEFCDLLAGFELFGKLVPRGDTFVAYVKSREAISDVLSVLGANNALKKLDAVSAARARTNNENRIQNCMAGNADKAAIASAAQTVALQKLQESGTLQTLPEALRQTALARLENPTLSLSELALTLGVSKGGLNHRMRKLMQIYKETEQ